MNFPPVHVILGAVALGILFFLLPPATVALVLIRQVSGLPPRSWLVPQSLLGFAVGAWALSGLIEDGGLQHHPHLLLAALSCGALPALLAWPGERSIPTSGGAWARLLGLALALGVVVGTYALTWANLAVRNTVLDDVSSLTLSPPYVAVPFSCSALFAVLLLCLRRTRSLLDAERTDTPFPGPDPTRSSGPSDTNSILTP